MREQNLEMMRFLRKHLYQHNRVRRMSAKAQRVIRGLIEVFLLVLLLLLLVFAVLGARLREALGDAGHARAVADYIAGMTDRYAIAEYERVLDPAQLT